MPQQHRIALDGYNAVQPDTFDWDFATTSTEDSGRAMSGTALITPLFTAESFSVEYTHLTITQAQTILHAIVQRPGKPFFTLHYFSPYFGTWRDARFYVGKGSLKVKTLKIGEEIMQNISCSFVGKEPLI